ncbi:hypothetical protein [Capillimicrobium parvum]|uniref:Uncharacterized protein n=1 Tax=Capillimicrobium parvum TaxID=2884022 RepID=A0A9E6Y0J8_9ACTN|nr:hypothetical protein [Capillimicrobium parvum]UGS37721.1 hypothetical protein DSM104329_04142 [Capillimicrobium parvum]
MAMTARQLYELLQDVRDTEEIVVRSPAQPADALLAAWRGAHEDSTRALAAWRAAPGGDGFAVYRAAEDRADAALDVLALR